MAPKRKAYPKAKKLSRPKSYSKRGSQSEKHPPDQDTDAPVKEHISTPNIAQTGDIPDLITEETCVFLFRSGTTDLAEVIKADQGSDVMSPEILLSKLEGCSKALQLLLNRPRSSGFSAVARLVDPSDQNRREQFARYFEEYWTDSVMEYFSCQADELDSRLRAGLLSVKDEWKYAKLGRQILYASGTIPCHDLDIDYAEWCRFSPKCVNQDIQEILFRIDDTYHSFQRRLYLESETPEELRLWYLIWTNLKKTFVLFSQHEDGFPSTTYLIEEELFTHSESRRLFEWVTTQLDYFCPQDIENLIGKYCELADRRLRESPEAPTALSRSHIQSLLSFPNELEWNYQALNALHHAVFRLNYLTQGPRLLRRLGRKVLFFLGDGDNAVRTQSRGSVSDFPTWLPAPKTTGENHEAAKALDAIRINDHSPVDHTPSGTSPFVELNEAINASPFGEEILDYEFSQDETVADLIPKPLNHEDNHGVVDQDVSVGRANENSKLEAFKNYIPRGRNIISAYDYVYCPVPENRSYEVANSRLIDRDLRTPGFVSDGLRTEDLVNLPPAHCRTPGTWTTWKRRIPLGPFEVFRLLGTAIADRVVGRSTARVIRPLAPPHVTSRAECQHRKHKRKFAAMHDPRTRVAKSSAGQRASLRGGGSQDTPAPDGGPRDPPVIEGGPRYTSRPEETPTRPPRSRRVREQRLASNDRSRGVSQDGLLATNSVPHRNSHPLLDQHSEPQDANSENQNPLAARPSSEDDVLRLHAGRTPGGRRPLGEIVIADDEEEESEESEVEGDPSDFILNPRGQLVQPVKRGVISGDGGDPLAGPFTFTAAVHRCHPCPIYEGQYHHECHERCGAKYHTIQNGDLLDAQFFRGSLWEHTNDRFVRAEDVATLDDFIERYHWTTTGRVSRYFFLSNGAHIQISRLPTGLLQYEVLSGPEDSNKASRFSLESSEFRPENLLESLPKFVSNIESRSPTNSQWFSEDFSSIDDLLSPRWPTGKLFRITYFPNISRERSLKFTVRLERFESHPWEKLVIVTEEVPPREPHARDYDATGLDDASEERRNAYPGYKDTLGFQSQLKGLKEANKKKQEDARPQAKEGAGGKDDGNIDTETDAPVGSNTAQETPTVISPQPQSQAVVVITDQPTNQTAKTSAKQAEKNTKDDKKTKPVGEAPADGPAKKSNDQGGHDDNDGKGGNAIIAKPTAAKKPRKALATTAPAPRLTRAAAKKAAEEAAKDDKKDDGDTDKAAKPQTGRKRVNRRRNQEDSDDELSDEVKSEISDNDNREAPKRKKAKTTKPTGKTGGK